MKEPSITLAEIMTFGPCEDRLLAAVNVLPKREPVTAAQARRQGMTMSDIVWAAASVATTDKDVERRLRMWMSDCAARVLHIFEDAASGDIGPRDAIKTARAYARGEAGEPARVAARVAAWMAAWGVAEASARTVARCAAEVAAWNPVGGPALNVALVAAGVATGDAEDAWQFDRLIQWLSADEPEPWPLPEAQS